MENPKNPTTEARQKAVQKAGQEVAQEIAQEIAKEKGWKSTWYLFLILQIPLILLMVLVAWIGIRAGWIPTS